MAEKIEVRAQLVDEMSKSLKKIEKNINDMSNKAEKGAGKATKGFNNLKSTMLSMKTVGIALAAVIGGKMVKSFIRAGSEVEDLTTEFKILLGSTTEAQKRIKELANFAATTPFQLKQVAQASKVLETFTKGALSTGDALRMVGDAAAITSEKDFAGLAMWVGRAYDGLQNNRPVGEAMMRLQELALVSGDARGKIEALQKAGRGKEAWKVLEGELGKAKGGMKALSQTATGLTSTLKDQLSEVMRQFIAGGVWDGYKKGLQSAVNVMDGIIKSGVITKIGKAFKVLLSPIKTLKFEFMTLGFAVTTGIDSLVGALASGVEKIQMLLFDLVGVGGKIGTAAGVALTQVNKLDAAITKLRVKTQGAKEFARQDMFMSATDLFGGGSTPEDKPSRAKATPTTTSSIGGVSGELPPGFGNIGATVNFAEQMASAEVQINQEKLDKIKEQEEQHNNEMIAIRQQSLDASFAVAQIASNAVFDIARTNANRETKMQIEKVKKSTKSEKEKQKEIEKIEREAFNRNKRRGISQILLDGAIGSAKTMANVGFPAAIPLLIVQAAATTAALATAAAQKYADGGIVQGGQSTGDKILTRQNAGEMNLNSKQQSNLFRMINKGQGGGIHADFSVHVTQDVSESTIAAVSTNQIEKMKMFRDLQRDAEYAGVS